MSRENNEFFRASGRKPFHLVRRLPRDGPQRASAELAREPHRHLRPFPKPLRLVPQRVEVLENHLNPAPAGPRLRPRHPRKPQPRDPPLGDQKRIAGTAGVSHGGSAKKKAAKAKRGALILAPFGPVPVLLFFPFVCTRPHCRRHRTRLYSLPLPQTATTSAGGSGNWSAQYSSPLGRMTKGAELLAGLGAAALRI